ncbi:MAG TPA: hypothetical protein VG308_04280 [Stellaceae bacterium]|jgi:hypothetical protein|nr:hypothetical protein [Stellaceae bacterium]
MQIRVGTLFPALAAVGFLAAFRSGVVQAQQAAPSQVDWRPLEHITSIYVAGLHQHKNEGSDFFRLTEYINFFPRDRQVAVVGGLGGCTLGTEQSAFKFLANPGRTTGDTVSCPQKALGEMINSTFTYQAKSDFTNNVLTFDGIGQIQDTAATLLPANLQNFEKHFSLMISGTRCQVLKWKYTWTERYTGHMNYETDEMAPNTKCAMSFDNGMYYESDGKAVNMRDHSGRTSELCNAGETCTYHPDPNNNPTKVCTLFPNGENTCPEGQ